MKFSIVVSTKRGIDALQPLFKISDENTEIIIISSDYSEETKNQLIELEHDFYQVIYAPSREKKVFQRDFSMCTNTAIAYAENNWIVKLDDSTEVKEDFFGRARNVVNKLYEHQGNDNFVVRAVKLEGWHGMKKWEYYPGTGDLHFNVTLLGRDGLGYGGLFTTFDTGFFPRHAIEKVNGYDERFDVGHGFDDNDLYQRFITAGFGMYLDRELMTYQGQHTTKLDVIDFIRPLWDFTFLEVINGKYFAFNPYSLKTLHKDFQEKKQQYIIKG